MAELLALAPGLKVLVTSRASLHLTGEYVHEVAPLAAPKPECHPTIDTLLAYPAIELFLERARQAKTSFALTDANAHSVAELCYSLDGLPLAIELAAARVRAFTPQTIITRLDHHTGGKLRFLTTGARDLPPRQQTLRATIDWSYNLLSPAEQAVFRQLGAFVGGCTLEAAESVCDPGIALGEPAVVTREPKRDIACLLESLVEKSLLQEVEGVAGESRYTMLETIREYALEQLEEAGEVDAIRRRHVRYYARKSDVDTASPDWSIVGTQVFKWLIQERHNLYAAMAWSRHYSDEPALHLCIVGALAWLAHVGRGYYGIRSDVNVIEAELGWSLQRNPQLPPGLHSRTLQSFGMLATSRGDHAAAARFYHECFALSHDAGDIGNEASAAHLCGWNAYVVGDMPPAEHFFARQLELGEQIGSRGWVVNGLNMLGKLALARQDLGRAAELLERALSVARAVGIKTDLLGGEAVVLQDMGVLAYEQGDYARAYQLGREALLIFAEEGEMQWRGIQHLYLGEAALAQQHNNVAERHLKECLQIGRELGLRTLPKFALAHLARAATQQGETACYARLMGALACAGPIPTQPRDLLTILEHNRFLDAIAEAKTHLDDPAFASAWADGQAMADEQLMAYALEELEPMEPL